MPFGAVACSSILQNPPAGTRRETVVLGRFSRWCKLARAASLVPSGSPASLSNTAAVAEKITPDGGRSRGNLVGWRCQHGGVDKAFRAIVAVVVRCLLPYFDPIKRQRLRRSAQALVTWDKWPGDDATALQVGQLALLRLLYLQSQTRVAARLRQSEATSLLARTSIDTCITAIWCLNEPDSVRRMRHQNAEMFGKMMSYMVGILVSPGLLTRLTAVIRGDEPAKVLPKLNQMAEAITRATEDRTTLDLYERFFSSSSTLVAHGGGLALLRHVDRSGGPSIQPSRAWMRRSAAHVADACVAILADALAQSVGADRDQYATYADAHLKRAMPPITSSGGEGVLRGFRWRALPATRKSVRGLRGYLDSPEFAADDDVRRASKIRPLASEFFALVAADMSEAEKSLFVEELVRLLSSQHEGDDGVGA